MQPQRILTIIPAYQAAPTLARVAAACPAPVLVVDDGSTDDTGAVARAAGCELISHPINRGKGAALRTAFAHAIAVGFDGVITLDADGQHDPAQIPLFHDAAAVGDYDLVVGERPRKGMPAKRRTSNTLTSLILSWRTGQCIEDSQCGFRFIRGEILRAVELSTVEFQCESELLIRAARAGFRIGSVPIRTIYAGERSHIRDVRDTWNFVRLVTQSLFW
ncbi:MAG: glycosyl transferase family 2 [Gemmatimonadetes bacterium]|nr:glycosyl transferase family 2 [Gemmatimonadota bacterium]